MNARSDRRSPTTLVISIPSLLLLIGMIEVAIGLIVYKVSNGNANSLWLWLLETISSTVMTLLLILPLLKRNQRVLEALSRSRITAVQALEREQELNRLKSKLISLVTHDFQTPLISIQGYISLLCQGYPNLAIETQRHYFNRMELSIDHLIHLLEQVLLIGKSDFGKLQCYSTKFNLKDLCDELIESLQLRSDRHLIKLSYVGDYEIEADSGLIRQILINLLTNAIKYSPNATPIRLAVQHKKDQLILQVEDQGIGIPLDEQPYLFELFHRCSNAQSIHGSGLGLAVVKASVDAHNGQIRINSQIGEGTIIIVMIPLTG
ncbi:sensor histidine kinase KdpD [Chroococcus sp. FPU101]|uniref:sensor histidine kinase n=1 Tax=Chroococcus sp. FPU101 TaxID=1974212 RepID=UPI001A8D19FB|nr:HAMP domain-containing sensor histidine kinase [Chroococcus sp. FPU101]